ncbi:MAG TPA: signal peptidase I [Anaerolineae bacterium]|nr:signal peptidase I [Anaerolineae bacterium]HQH39905.1 signal peptidase I [Anaerolineae bacterium]
MWTDQTTVPGVETNTPGHAVASKTEGATSVWAWFRDLLETLALAAIIFLVVNTFTGRYEVQSISMEPTLHEGQYLIVSKVAYWFHAPERGDIVVLDPPRQQSDIPYIKRVIGLPGERVEIRDGRVWINGIALNEPYISGPPSYSESQVLGDNEYLVLGDNRNNSSDSHVWGVLPRDHIIGKSIFRYWPPEKVGLIPHYTFPELESNP